MRDGLPRANESVTIRLFRVVAEKMIKFGNNGRGHLQHDEPVEAALIRREAVGPPLECVVGQVPGDHLAVRSQPTEHHLGVFEFA